MQRSPRSLSMTAICIWVALTVITSPSPSFAGGSACQILFEGPSALLRFSDFGVEADHIFVTGEADYPLLEVLKALELTPQTIERLKKSRQVVSIAEGLSGLLPYLLDHQVKTIGVDLWYRESRYPDTPHGRRLKAYNDKYGQHLRRGDARHLEFADESIDVVLSHKFVNNLHIADTLRVFSEMVRILSIGGEARISDVYKKTFYLIEKFSLEHFGTAVSLNWSNDLLIVRKQTALPKNLNIRIPYDNRYAYPGVPNGR